jgi:hypothetical protein
MTGEALIGPVKLLLIVSSGIGITSLQCITDLFDTVNLFTYDSLLLKLANSLNSESRRYLIAKCCSHAILSIFIKQNNVTGNSEVVPVLSEVPRHEGKGKVVPVL